MKRTTADILANDQLLRAKEYEPLIVAYRNGAAVRLSDIASVRDSVENIRAAGYLNGKPAIPLVIFRQPGANIIQTVDRVKAALPSLKASVPAAINMQIVLDRTQTIRASVFEVERTLVIAVLLVVLVVFIFLRNGRATLIPAVVVPTSLIGTFGVMYLCGYSLDNLSLMALTISTGFVVDDAIVVIENVTRHLEQGVRPMQAALKGAREVGFTVLSISVSLVAVFTPILLMGGIVGRLFREFAVTLSTAILVSLVISLTTTPMMCARLLRQDRQSKTPGPISKLTESVFAWISDRYKGSLQVVLRHPAITLGVLIATIAATGYLFMVVPKGFFPQQDNGTVFGGMQGSQDTSFQAMQGAALRVSNAIKTDPAVASVVNFVGGNSATNSGFVYVALKPLNERKISSSEVINRVRPKLGAIPGAMTFLQADGVHARPNCVRAELAQRRFRKHDFRAGVLQYEGDRIRSELDVDGHRDDAGAHAAQQCRDEFHAIERQDADPVARNQTGARAAARHGIAHLVERAIADFVRACRVVQIDDGYALGIRMRSKQRSQVAGIAAWFGFRNRGRRRYRPGRAHGQTITLPNTSRSSINLRPCAACASGSTSSITGFILPCTMRSISAFRFSS